MTTAHLSQGSSELFDSDPELLDALASVKLPQTIPHVHKALPHTHSNNHANAPDYVQSHPSENASVLGKRSRSSSPPDATASYIHQVPDTTTQSNPRNTDVSDVYGPSKFGGLDEYMRRKRAKLQIQNTAIAAEGEEPKPALFKGVQIYVCMHVQ